jgi:galactokinase
VAAGRPDGILRLLNVNDGRAVEFRIGPDLEPSPGHWSNYPMTVARRIAQNFPGPPRGADVAFASDLPPAAGMSSSSAMVVLTFLILDAANRLSRREAYQRNIPSAEALGEYLGCVENGQSCGPLAGGNGVGTFGGSEDHTAILCCRPGQLSQYSFCPVELERTIALPAGHVMGIGVSGVAAEKTGEAQEKYNRVSRLTGEMVRLWGKRQNHTEHGGSRSLTLASAVRSAGLAEMSRALRAGSDMFGAEEMLARLEQFTLESERIIPAAGDALERDDLDAWGLLVDESQKRAEIALGNQVPETIFLARAARDMGAVAASAFGAGFGGSVWAMVRAAEAEAFAGHWSAVYRQTFPQHAGRASFFITRAGPGAMRLA